MSLEEVLLRLRWAEEQLMTLESDFAVLRSADLSPPSVEVKEGGKVREYSVADMPEISSDLGLRLGDCIHNFRATLDNLAFTIASENNPGGLSSAERRAVSFPITDQRAAFRQASTRDAIAKMPRRAQACIQRLQPFKYGTEAQTHPLFILRQLSNLDKHRSIPVVRWTARHPLVSPEIPSARVTPLAEELVPNTKFLRITLPREYADVKIEVSSWILVTIRSRAVPEVMEAEDWLDEIEDWVKRAISDLAVFCRDASPDALMDAWDLVDRPYRIPAHWTTLGRSTPACERRSFGPVPPDAE